VTQNFKRGLFPWGGGTRGKLLTYKPGCYKPEKPEAYKDNHNICWVRSLNSWGRRCLGKCLSKGREKAGRDVNEGNMNMGGGACREGEKKNLRKTGVLHGGRTFSVLVSPSHSRERSEVKDRRKKKKLVQGSETMLGRGGAPPPWGGSSNRIFQHKCGAYSRY